MTCIQKTYSKHPTYRFDITRFIVHLGSWVLCASILITIQAHAELQLNGISTFTSLKADQYVAAIYSEQVSDQPEKLLDSSLKRRMELRVVAPNIFLRSFVQTWVYGMAINNSKEQIYKNAFQVIAFSDCLKDNLQKGDILVIEYFPKKGMSLSLNYVELQTFPGEDFFNILLRTWIGSVPPSSSMKMELLMGDKEKSKELFATYSELSPSQQRVDEIRTWASGKNGNNAKTNAAADDAKASPTDSSTKENTATQTKPATPPKTAATKQTAANTKTERQKEEPQKTQPSNDPEKSTAKPAQTPAKYTEPARETLTVASFLSKRDYLEVLSEWAKKKVSYPVILTDDTATDSVNFDIVIDRNGVVKEITPTNESKSKVLNNGALKAINQSSPFPKIPPEISGNSFSFSLNFSLHRRYSH
jgi:periplasmic protein TonB